MLIEEKGGCVRERVSEEKRRDTSMMVHLRGGVSLQESEGVLPTCRASVVHTYVRLPAQR